MEVIVMFPEDGTQSFQNSFLGKFRNLFYFSVHSILKKNICPHPTFIDTIIIPELVHDLNFNLSHLVVSRINSSLETE
jgi:hypothetical protein